MAFLDLESTLRPSTSDGDRYHCLDRTVPHRRSGRCKKLLLAGVGAVGIAALGLPSSAAIAATATATFAVTATVQATCLISATAVAFGVYTGAIATSTGTLTVTCTNTTPYNIGLSAGLATGATVTTRQMQGPAGALLNYVLTQDAAHVTNWGNTTGSWEAGTGNGTAQLVTVYGQVAASQSPTPGSYSDTITATVNY
jgi:spore coat protein U-like protein